MTEPAEAQSKRPTRQLAALGALWPYMRRYRGLAAAWLAFLALSSAATLALPVAVRHMIDRGFASHDAALINGTFVALFVLALILAISTAARYFCITLLGERAIAALRGLLYSRVIRLDVAFYEKTRVGELVSRLGTDTEVVQTLIGSSISIALRSVVMVIGAAALMVWTSPRLAGLTALVIPVVIVPIALYGRRLAKLSRANQDRIADTSAIANETLNSVHAVKAYAREAIESARYAGAVQRALRAAQKRITARAILTGGVIMLVFSAVTLVLWAGARGVLAGTINAGLVTQFALYAVMAAGSVGALGGVWGDVLRAAGSMGRISELLAERPSIADPAQPQSLPQPTQGALAFEHVEFRYPTRPDTPALHDFSLRIQPGQTVALVGPSGAGKSTVFNLLLRFHDPQRGRITLDGVDLRALKLDELRGALALVPQETVIFGASAADNIRFGRADAGDEAVFAAARAAEAYGFLSEQPQGFDTQLGERGVRLSGGQRQRIAIARAILKDAPVLLLDEATSSLDAQSEAAIQSALERAGRGRTTLVIAHRLATVQRADRIVVMDQGRIIADGSHDALLREGGLYAELARLQFAA
ncbi:MAG TPA: ABC transporter transmembrane domain-containing protein [Rhodanobacteraceae bacterium]|jgi:ATP-binding cassette subfamily B protein|nr:ABC transporter transmembrane domain-containing protein [Rhodanobacteraceae bacterium]